MIPYKTTIVINRKDKQPIYLQIANKMAYLVKTGIVVPGAKLPGSRTLAKLLGVHRNTVVMAYEELLQQGWVMSKPQRGVFVQEKLPIVRQQPIMQTAKVQSPINAGFPLKQNTVINRPDVEKISGYSYINDGVCDERLAPIHEIAREYRSLASQKGSLDYLGYGSIYGNLLLRKVLADYLNQTRGLHITHEQLLVTRGSQMALYLAAKTLLDDGSYVIIGETNYVTADATLGHVGAKILRVPVDADGLHTESIKLLCTKHKIKAVYVTSHHHHPTTVTLSAKRRMQLLHLARSYNFAIVEDDYDYDFHYDHAPILPLASHDEKGNVVYIGSVCKTVAPVYRIGYLIAPKAFVDQCAQLRRIIDRQGDALLELAFANYIKSGALDRHIKKVLKIYATRRNLFCSLLTKELGDYISFRIPKGGMAVWVCLHKKYNWQIISQQAQKLGLIIGDWQRYDNAQTGHNGIRMGFASYTEAEMKKIVHILKKACSESYPTALT